jgi:F-type H+-transporting ATPase subunit a
MAQNRVKCLLALVFSVFMLTNANVVVAQDQHPAQAHDANATANHKPTEKEFNVTETILEHISDDHSWHLWGHTSIALPVILKTDKGWETFSSAKLINEHHEPIAYTGTTTGYQFKVNTNHETGKKSIVILDAEGNINKVATASILDMSITKNVASMFIAVFLLLVIFLSVAASYKKRGITTAPKGFQNVMETLILFVRDEIARPNIGEKYFKYMPFLLTVFFFIFINNLLGLIPFIPGGANVSGNIAFTMTLAVFTFIVVNFSGNKNYWKHIFWMPGVAVPMKIFLMPIEVIGIFTKPISLMIRLFANITAGHILVLSLVCLIFIFKSVAASAVAIPFTVFISCIELLVAFLQAFIFTMLSALYIGMATEEHHDDHH